MNIIKTFFPMFLIAFLLVAVTFPGDGQFSTFASGFSKYCMAVASAWFVDKFLVPGINTHEILKDNPIAYSIFLFANILCAGLCIANS
jgi:hypothetical protein